MPIVAIIIGAGLIAWGALKLSNRKDPLAVVKHFAKQAEENAIMRGKKKNVV